MNAYTPPQSSGGPLRSPAMHMAARPLKLDLDHLPQLKLPCILHWDMAHFVVLRVVNRDGITIHDPARGVVRLPMAEVSTHFSGVALEKLGKLLVALTKLDDIKDKDP